MLHKCYNATVPELSKNITCGIRKQVRFLDPMFTMLQSWSVSNISANFLAGLMHWCLKSKLHTKMIEAYHVHLDAKKTQNPSHSKHHGFQHLRFKKTVLHVIHQFKACSQPSPLIINQEPKRLNMNKWLFSSSPWFPLPALNLWDGVLLRPAELHLDIRMRYSPYDATRDNFRPFLMDIKNF